MAQKQVKQAAQVKKPVVVVPKLKVNRKAQHDRRMAKKAAKHARRAAEGKPNRGFGRAAARAIMPQTIPGI